MTASQLDRLAINTIKTLTMDAVEKAKSGHPGLPMGAADYAYLLWMRFLKHDPSSPAWPDRDRFVLSAGHGSMLLYSLLHLFGYNVSMDQLKSFRQWESGTPGHPEYDLARGIETTTGPLGQGFGNGVGMALAEALLAMIFNDEEFTIVDHRTYAITSDGDMMEGVASEAASLAGHLGLGKLIYFYDDNRITIEGSTSLAFSEDVGKRFEAYNWHVVRIDGHDHAAIERAIREGQAETSKPTLIVCRTHIAHGSPNKHDSAEAHGEPLGEEEVRATKEHLGWPRDANFLVPDEVRELFALRRTELEAVGAVWRERFESWRKARPEKAKLWDEMMGRKLPRDILGIMPSFKPGDSIATRSASGSILQELAKAIPSLVGGSADLAPSTKTIMKAHASVAPRKFDGRNFHFGVREHGMGAILSGISLHDGFIPFGATFLVFSDYMRASIRLAAVMHLPVIYVFTHDSVFVGEDGPTHEPVEHFAALRAIPNMLVIRPSDATETAAAWAVALQRTEGPTALLLSRQNLPVLDRRKLPSPQGLEYGAYTLVGEEIAYPDMILLATGSEVHIALGAGEELAARGKKVRVVSMPSWELFEKQPKEYREKVLPANAPLRLSIEAGTDQGWHKYVGEFGASVCVKRFGASAPFKVIAEKLGFTSKDVAAVALRMIEDFPARLRARLSELGKIPSGA